MKAKLVIVDQLRRGRLGVLQSRSHNQNKSDLKNSRNSGTICTIRWWVLLRNSPDKANREYS
jgi:hypothetical protein